MSLVGKPVGTLSRCSVHRVGPFESSHRALSNDRTCVTRPCRCIIASATPLPVVDVPPAVQCHGLERKLGLLASLERGLLSVAAGIKELVKPEEEPSQPEGTASRNKTDSEQESEVGIGDAEDDELKLAQPAEGWREVEWSAESCSWTNARKASLSRWYYKQNPKSQDQERAVLGMQYGNIAQFFQVTGKPVPLQVPLEATSTLTEPAVFLIYTHWRLCIPCHGHLPQGLCHLGLLGLHLRHGTRPRAVFSKDFTSESYCLYANRVL